ncbi:MAG TPA: dipeptide epimerase [Candidatus Dormibacteraeota bacterium]|nr:dipeptide epimerase [Candidatus Dormibacteraeota bacterium]
MKLTFRRIQLQLAHKWTIARTAGTNVSEVLVVELVGADGTVGLGEASPVSRYKESVDTVEEFCKKVDPRGLSFKDIEGSMTYLDTISRHDMAAKCALNIALLDGAAKRDKKAIYDYLDLGFREGQHVTSFTIGIDKPDAFKQKVVEAKKYPILKVKVGVPDDKLNMQALREVAPTKTVRVDANEGWKTKEQALEMIEWLATDKNIQYVEQPLPASTSVKDWVWLKEKSPLPIFGDESYHTAKDITQAAECFHGVNVKLVKTGGISGGYDALQAARKAGLKTMLGCMIETSILISAGAHLAELCDYLDLDGNILITNDPYQGVVTEKGMLSFANVPEKTGLRVGARA